MSVFVENRVKFPTTSAQKLFKIAVKTDFFKTPQKVPVKNVGRRSFFWAVVKVNPVFDFYVKLTNFIFLHVTLKVILPVYQSADDDDGSQRDNNTIPSISITTTTAAAATAGEPTSSSSMIVMNEDVPLLVSCSLIVNHDLSS